ncbi:AlpA family phage regulatory protein [Ottowia sp.]|uniref:helix-turn-helix transcriptional regulator n=1 Tax=Ottowia sp. TaxID=1898956 RepID=UPI002D1FBDD2|nr:AlpA family phage regulatory protein [Ottowia sp.]
MNICTASHLASAALDKASAAEFLALSVSTFERLVREGRAPRPRQLSGRRVAWIRTELEAWLHERPVSELLPPANTGAPKRRARPAPLSWRSGHKSAATSSDVRTRRA